MHSGVHLLSSPIGHTSYINQKRNVACCGALFLSIMDTHALFANHGHVCSQPVLGHGTLDLGVMHHHVKVPLQVTGSY